MIWYLLSTVSMTFCQKSTGESLKHGDKRIEELIVYTKTIPSFVSCQLYPSHWSSLRLNNRFIKTERVQCIVQCTPMCTVCIYLVTLSFHCQKNYPSPEADNHFHWHSGFHLFAVWRIATQSLSFSNTLSVFVFSHLFSLDFRVPLTCRFYHVLHFGRLHGINIVSLSCVFIYYTYLKVHITISVCMLIVWSKCYINDNTTQTGIRSISCIDNHRMVTSISTQYKVFRLNWR